MTPNTRILTFSSLRMGFLWAVSLLELNCDELPAKNAYYTSCKNYPTILVGFKKWGSRQAMVELIPAELSIVAMQFKAAYLTFQNHSPDQLLEL